MPDMAGGGVSTTEGTGRGCRRGDAVGPAAAKGSRREKRAGETAMAAEVLAMYADMLRRRGGRRAAAGVSAPIKPSLEEDA